ncbi:L,D-transpeptidase family protein [Gilvimarinus sp. F26214L]|uniref:L,D-transpeptidase family protein n=1 Tax=Gilvimarinus sp. DZF01 TaxID=3461371 RepID=UPI004045CD63
MIALWLWLPGCAAAASYPLGNPLVGQASIAVVGADDTLMDIARLYGVGHHAIRRANPDLDPWLPGEGSEVVIPSLHLLPDAPREGLVLNRSEMRLYYFHRDGASDAAMVTTFPVGIGRTDRQTPLGRGKVTMKLHQPAWYPTANVRADYAARGKSLAPMIPPGPDNPLGEWAMVLDIPGFLIHGTNRPDGVGMLVSQGCVRLYPENIEELVQAVPVGTPVTVVDQAVKVALVEGELMVEVHPRVYPDDGPPQPGREQRLLHRIMTLLERRGNELKGEVDWEAVSQVARRADGIPTVVSSPLVASRP